MSKHELKRQEAGKGMDSIIIPTCSCGWMGRPEYAHNDHQYSNVQEQEREHLYAHSEAVLKISNPKLDNPAEPGAITNGG